MTFEEFRNLAQGFQAIFLSVGAIIASIWAIYTFKSTLSVQKAKAELEKIRKEAAKLQVEMDSTPMIGVEMKSSIIGSKEAKDLVIRLKLNIKNTGNTPEYIDYNSSQILAAKFTGVLSEKLQHDDSIQGLFVRVDADADGISLWPKEEVTEEVIIPIKEHGIYLIESVFYISKESTNKVASLMNSDEPNPCFGIPLVFDTRI